MTRNPIAKAVRRLRPQVVPNRKKDMKPEILLPEIVAGVNAGSRAAIEKARQTGTMLVVADVNGKPIMITPDEAERMMDE